MRWHCSGPRSDVCHQPLGQQQELAHYCGDCDLGWLACRAKLAILPSEFGVAIDRRYSGHVKRLERPSSTAQHEAASLPSPRLTGNRRQVRLAAPLGSSEPISGISASMATAVTAPIPGMDFSISKARACDECDFICFNISASSASRGRSMCRRRRGYWRLSSCTGASF